MADKPKSILVYSKQAPKLGYRLVTPLQQPLPTITKTPILPIMGGVNINVPTPVLPSQQRTPINLPMADRLINVPSPVAPVKDKSENKKPLEWGFKGRKKTDIEDLLYFNFQLGDFFTDSDYKEKIKENMKKLDKGAKKNKYLDKRANDFFYPEYSRLGQINEEFKTLEGEGVPRELTGKMIGNKLGKQLLLKKQVNNSITPDFYRDWKTGWLRYYNELNKSQKETFDSLSDEWYGTVNELVDTSKSL